MRTNVRYLIIGVVSAAVFPAAIVITAPSASADCNNTGYATVCAQGTVTGGSTQPVAGPVYPGYCADPWYCSDDWGIDVDIDRPGRPGGPGGGGGGGIGPRR